MKSTNLHFVFLLSLSLLSSCVNEQFDDYVEPFEFTEDGSIAFEFNTSPEIEATIDKGLAVFTKPGRIQSNAACVNCHTPDAFDLAFFDFKREDILRRALPHVSEDDAKAIADMIEATRVKYRIDSPKSPRSHRLFQPGGIVLSGNTRGERDYNFLKNELPKWVPTLFAHNEIRDVATALKIRDEIANINLSKMMVGIPLPLWASDNFHGKEFGTVDEWMPNMPCIDLDPNVQNYRTNYQKYPSRQNLKLLVNIILSSTDCGLAPNERGRIGKRFARDKYVTGLIAMHIQREEIFGIPASKDGDFQLTWWDENYINDHNIRKSIPSNRVWGIGDKGRKPGRDTGLRSGNYPRNSAKEFLEITGFSQFSIDGQTNVESDFLLQNDLQTSWFWLNAAGFDSARHTGYSRLGMSRSGYAGHALLKSYFDSFKKPFGSFSYSNSSVFHPKGHSTNKLSSYAEQYEAPAEWQALYDSIQTKLSWVMLFVTKAWLDDPNTRDIVKNDDLRGMAKVTNFLWRRKGFQEAYDWYYSYGPEVAKHLEDKYRDTGDMKGYMDLVLDDITTGGPGDLRTENGHEKIEDEDYEFSDGISEEYNDLEE